MRSKVILTITCFFLANSVFTCATFSAVVIKGDGTRIVCNIDGEQTIRVKTTSGESIIRLKEITWMAGEDIKRIRLSKGERIQGRLYEQNIEVIEKGKISPLSSADIVFLYNTDRDNLEKISSIRLVGCDHVDGSAMQRSFTATFYEGTGPGLKVSLLVGNWEGDVIKISNPIYSREAAGGSDFEITFDAEAGDDIYTDMSKLASELVVCVSYFPMRAPGTSGSYMAAKKSGRTLGYKAADRLPARKGAKKPISMKFPGLFSGHRGGKVYGSGELYIYMARLVTPVVDDGGLSLGTSTEISRERRVRRRRPRRRAEEKLGAGSLTIEKTVSNVLSIPITIKR